MSSGKIGKKLVRCARNWLAQIVDPVSAADGLVGYLRYSVDWYRCARMPGAKAIHIADTCPEVQDRTRATEVDLHYFYGNGCAMRRIIFTAPRYHVDVGSHVIFANLLAASIPTILDYRPLLAPELGLQCLAGNTAALPFADCSISSLSCLHVIEHIGPGRYGEPLNPYGTRKAVIELAHVLAPGGNLYVVVPVGRARLRFNAHRIHQAETIQEYLSGLQLVNFLASMTMDGLLNEPVLLCSEIATTPAECFGLASLDDTLSI